QSTNYVYGTTLDNSDIASSGLLRSVIYPDDTKAEPDRIVLAYNRQVEAKQKQDQTGTIHAYDRDLLGRLINDRVVTLGTAVDGTVLRLGYGYEVRGMLESVTSYNNATVGSGSVVNDVLNVYNNFVQLIGQYQAHSGTATTSSPGVQYGYADGSANT